jgi:cytochrome-b5 reductase
VTHNTKLFTFELPEPESTLGLIVNSCILTRYKGLEDAKPIVRPYTPVSDENAKVPPSRTRTPKLTKGYFQLLVKKYPNGPMSTHLHDMNTGQRLQVRGPIAKYKWEENKYVLGRVGGVDC